MALSKYEKERREREKQREREKREKEKTQKKLQKEKEERREREAREAEKLRKKNLAEQQQKEAESEKQALIKKNRGAQHATERYLDKLVHWHTLDANPDSAREEFAQRCKPRRLPAATFSRKEFSQEFVRKTFQPNVQTSLTQLYQIQRARDLRWSRFAKIMPWASLLVALFGAYVSPDELWWGAFLGYSLVWFLGTLIFLALFRLAGRAIDTRLCRAREKSERTRLLELIKQETKDSIARDKEPFEKEEDKRYAAFLATEKAFKDNQDKLRAKFNAEQTQLGQEFAEKEKKRCAFLESAKNGDTKAISELFTTLLGLRFLYSDQTVEGKVYSVNKGARLGFWLKSATELSLITDLPPLDKVVPDVVPTASGTGTKLSNRNISDRERERLYSQYTASFPLCNVLLLFLTFPFLQKINLEVAVEGADKSTGKPMNIILMQGSLNTKDFSRVDFCKAEAGAALENLGVSGKPPKNGAFTPFPRQKFSWPEKIESARLAEPADELTLNQITRDQTDAVPASLPALAGKNTHWCDNNIVWYLVPLFKPYGEA